jgi:hypothetical protein
MFGYSDSGMQHESGNISQLSLLLSSFVLTFFYLLHIVVLASLTNLRDVERIGFLKFISKLYH